METFLLRSVLPRKTLQWVDDTNINVCYSCHEEFGFFIRKHHCRGCGRIFCDKCSRWKISYKNIPHGVIISRNEYCKFWGLNNHREKDKELIVKHRSCQNCFNLFKKLNALYKFIKIFEFTPLTIPELIKLKGVCVVWCEAINVILSHFREIQYLLPLHQYTELEKHLLYTNRDLIMGHNRYMKHLLLCFPYLDFTIQNKEKKISCKSLLCSSTTCQEEPTTEDVLDVLLYSPSLILRGKMLKFLPKDIHNILPLLTYAIRFESRKSSPLVQLLITKSLQSLKLRYYLFWELIVQLEEEQYHDHYHEVMQYFLEQIYQLLGKEDYEQLLLCYDSHKNLANVNIDCIDLKKKNYIPCYPQFSIKHIHQEEISYKPSATRPVLIPLQSNKNKLHKVIFKREDIRKDRLITLIFKTMDQILKQHGEDFYIVTYDVLPIILEGGFIEIVENCSTIYDLNKKNLTIQNFIMQHNPDENISTVKQRFIKSTAAYCVMTFLLGIGDRHLDNIMVTKDGKLFHIDFGFILGKDPKKMMAPLIRIIPEMVDAIGGHGENYELFKKECYKCYEILRKYPNLIFNMLFLLTKIDKNITPKCLKDEIIKRFMPGETKFIANIKMDTTIKNSTETSNSMSYIDILHGFKKEYVNDFWGSISSWWS